MPKNKIFYFSALKNKLKKTNLDCPMATVHVKKYTISINVAPVKSMIMKEASKNKCPNVLKILFLSCL